jgi:hypothetical protein
VAKAKEIDRPIGHVVSELLARWVAGEIELAPLPTDQTGRAGNLVDRLVADWRAGDADDEIRHPDGTVTFRLARSIVHVHADGVAGQDDHFPTHGDAEDTFERIRQAAADA